MTCYSKEQPISFSFLNLKHAIYQRSVLNKSKPCKNNNVGIKHKEVGLVVCFVCLFGIYRPTWEFSTYMETSPLLLKGCKFWPMLNTHGNWSSSEGSLACHTYCNMGHLRGHLREPVTFTCMAERLAVELSSQFLRFRSVETEIWTPNLSLAGPTSRPYVSLIVSMKMTPFPIKCKETLWNNKYNVIPILRRHYFFC